MPNPTPLSPAAQAVLDAVITDNQTGPERFHARAHAAAALRAAVATAGLKTPGGGVVLDGNFLLAIAAELEGGTSTSSTHLEIGDE